MARRPKFTLKDCGDVVADIHADLAAFYAEGCAFNQGETDGVVLLLVNDAAGWRAYGKTHARVGHIAVADLIDWAQLDLSYSMQWLPRALAVTLFADGPPKSLTEPPPLGAFHVAVMLGGRIKVCTVPLLAGERPEVVMRPPEVDQG
jgi:hypothetical protein